jgi:hypothetical protein
LGSDFVDYKEAPWVVYKGGKMCAASNAKDLLSKDYNVL